MTSRATYVYCLVRSARTLSSSRVPPGLPGAARPEVTALSDGLWLVTASVPLDRYGPGALEPALRDLDWVGAVALAHEAVVEHFARVKGSTVVPMKLFTMFSTLERAQADIRQRRRVLARVFRHVEGCEEWGVRVTRVEPRTRARRTARPASGAAFLAARKQARDAAAEAAQSAVQAAEKAFASLAEMSRDQKRRRDGAAGSPPLLDAAFLVPAGRRARFRTAARRLAREVAQHGGQMTLTGPWPPYNFVGAEGGA